MNELFEITSCWDEFELIVQTKKLTSSRNSLSSRFIQINQWICYYGFDIISSKCKHKILLELEDLIIINLGLMIILVVEI